MSTDTVIQSMTPTDLKSKHENGIPVNLIDVRTPVEYPNVFSLGDCSSLPTSKSGAAVRKQARVLMRNLKALIRDQPLTSSYNGSTACPVVTGYGSLILAEVDDDLEPDKRSGSINLANDA